MKTLTTLVCLSFLTGAVRVIATPVTLTFDGLTTASNPGTSSYSPVPNGYGGLHWNNFDAIDVTTVQQQDNGYHTGLISPNNVAFNPNGNSASITGSTPFDLYSGYLTSTVDYYTSFLYQGNNLQVHGMQVEVEGFSGNHLLYDNIYALQEGGPSLINFNYIGVSSVEFITEVPGYGFKNPYIFVVDDLTISVPDETDTLTLLSGATGLCALVMLTGRIKRLQHV